MHELIRAYPLATLIAFGEISESELIGKWKVSQNRPEQDKAGVIAGLLGSGVSEASQMARLVEQGAG